MNSECPVVANQRVPLFRGGYCLRIDDSSFRAYGRDGQFAFASVPQIPGPTSAIISDIAADPEGGFVLVAANRSSRGLVFVDHNGIQKDFVAVTGYYPSHVAVAEDRSIWVLGATPAEALHQPTVYKYSPAGKQTGAYLPVSAFPAGTLVPGLGGSETWILAAGGVVTVVVRSGADSNLHNLREVIRMDYSGAILSRSRLDNVREIVFAVTAEGTLYRCDNEAGAAVYRLDAAGRNWEKMSKPLGATSLFGAEGGDLVYRSADSDKVRMAWYAPPGLALE